MTNQTRPRRSAIPYFLPVATMLFAIAVFIADTGTGVETAFAMLYVVVVLMATRFLPARGVLLVATGCAALSVMSFFLTPPPTQAAIANLFINLLAIALTAIIGMRGRAVETTPLEKANILELTHDAIFSRSMDNRITFWNSDAEAMYRQHREVVVGSVPFQLLKTVFPVKKGEVNGRVMLKVAQ